MLKFNSGSIKKQFSCVFLFVMQIFIVIAIANMLMAQTLVPAGDIGGLWTFSNSPYMVSGEIIVPYDSALIIEPGVEVIFVEHHKFMIHGQLLAQGTRDSMIIFTAENKEIGWHGLRFLDGLATNDSSKLVYCKVQYGLANGPSEEDRYGGGVGAKNFNKLLIAYCQITENRTVGTLNSGGAGMVIVNCSPQIKNNLISNNSASGGHGGGIFISEAFPILSNNIISGNSAYGGGGLSAHMCRPIFINNTITNNWADHGGAIDCLNGNATFINCILHGNVATDIGNEVHLSSVSSSVFLYCDIAGGIAAFAEGHDPGAPSYEGVYEYNIESEPEFLDTSIGFDLADYSPCIGKGIDSIMVDSVWYKAPPTDYYGENRPRPAGSRPDIGAIENDRHTTGLSLIVGSSRSRLVQIHPNPFAKQTSISYHVDQSNNVTIEIRNLTGKLITTLQDRYHYPGEYEVNWNEAGIPVGVYICTMTINKGIDSKIIVLQ